jgi:hypothetical protein
MRLLPLTIFSFGVAAAAGAEVSFNREVLPILSDKCFHCHGFDKDTREADLRLDRREGAIATRKGVTAIVPGNPKASAAIAKIHSADPDEVMPPPESHLTLSAAEKDILTRWVAQGAKYEAHWAFVAPPSGIKPPEVANKAWPRTEIDRFVLARLEQEKLAPSREATRERWLRRVTFDLTGLPPAQADLDGFLADSSPTAYETVADRLLASPEFGERMATPWLDTARYADSFGYQADADMQAWPYRDWVIRSLNANLPWDKFITEQIAGDLLPGATRDQKLATAFNRLHRKTNEGGSIPEEMLQDGISDRVHTVATAFLGLTFECARCHDHKYDPILAKDYYSLAAFFNSIDEFGVLQGGGNRGLVLPQPAMLLPTPAQDAAMASQAAEVQRIEKLAADLPAANEPDFQSWLTGPKSLLTPERVAHLPLDEIAHGALANQATAAQTAKPGGNKITPGKIANGLLCNGDDPISITDFDIKHCHDPMAISFWLKPAEDYPRAVLLANTTSFDANYSGYELLLENGQLRWTLMREFPGNAISIQATEKLKLAEWSHVTVTYDGSSKAAGMRIFLNGAPAASTVIRDHLTRDFRAADTLNFVARGRDFGLRGGSIDDIHIFKRAIAPIEVRQFFDGSSLSRLLEKSSLTAGETAVLRDYYFSAVHPAARELAVELLTARSAWRATVDAIPEISIMEETPQPKPTFTLIRGAYDHPGDMVTRDTPAFLPPFPKNAPLNRLGYAQWLTMPDHPLTARVLVNRLWQEFFGAGIVSTSENFGLQGARPSHPELLDWLARDFISHRWDHKRACRQIVLSATYRQDSAVGLKLRERDPNNALLARGPARRLSAEMLRDSALALGGLLHPQLGGPPVHPYQPEGSMWKTLNNFLPDYREDKGHGVHRRSLYTFWRRTTTPPNMMIFDATTRETCSTRRQTTNTPLQPLVMLNDPQFVEAARALGERILKEGGTTDAERAAWGFRLVTGRPATARELPVLLELFQSQRATFAANPADAAKLLKVGQLNADTKIPAIETAAAATFASALLNLDASISLR